MGRRFRGGGFVHWKLRAFETNGYFWRKDMLDSSRDGRRVEEAPLVEGSWIGWLAAGVGQKSWQGDLVSDAANRDGASYWGWKSAWQASCRFADQAQGARVAEQRAKGFDGALCD